MGINILTGFVWRISGRLYDIFVLFAIIWFDLSKFRGQKCIFSSSYCKLSLRELFWYYSLCTPMKKAFTVMDVVFAVF